MRAKSRDNDATALWAGNARASALRSTCMAIRRFRTRGGHLQRANCACSSSMCTGRYRQLDREVGYVRNRIIKCLSLMRFDAKFLPCCALSSVWERDRNNSQHADFGTPPRPELYRKFARQAQPSPRFYRFRADVSTLLTSKHSSYRSESLDSVSQSNQ